MSALENNNVAAPEWFPDSEHLRVSRVFYKLNLDFLLLFLLLYVLSSADIVALKSQLVALQSGFNFNRHRKPYNMYYWLLLPLCFLFN